MTLAATGSLRAQGSSPRYVALGSSYAAGPGIGPADLDAPPGCRQSINNYPHLLARKRSLQLVDHSCSGATTNDVLHGGQLGLPAQLDAVTADTRVVTITIGGNDVGFVGDLACATRGSCQIDWPQPASWDRLTANLRQIAVSVHQRAPQARLVFVDYLTILPQSGTGCAELPMSSTNLDRLRELAAHLASVTAAVARENDALLLRASALTASHDACSADPWSTGLVRDKGSGAVPFHPNAEGMARIAQALDELLDTAGH